MTIALPSELERFIAEQVDQGIYSSPEDMIRVGIELLREQHLIDQIPHEELRQQIMIGIEQADRGDVAPFDPIGTLAEIRRRKRGV